MYVSRAGAFLTVLLVVYAATSTHGLTLPECQAACFGGEAALLPFCRTLGFIYPYAASVCYGLLLGLATPGGQAACQGFCYRFFSTSLSLLDSSIASDRFMAGSLNIPSTATASNRTVSSITIARDNIDNISSLNSFSMCCCRALGTECICNQYPSTGEGSPQSCIYINFPNSPWAECSCDEVMSVQGCNRWCGISSAKK